MPLTLAVNENNDIYLDANGNLALATGIDAVLILCARAAKAQLGEMVLNTDQGMPNFQTIWNGSPNVAQFEAALRRTLLQVVDVLGVTGIDVALTNNVLRYTATIITAYGEGVING